MGIFSRIFGICRTPLLENAEAWTLDGNELILALDRIPDLQKTGSAVRIEDERLPHRVLVVHAHDDGWYAFRNRCAHAGRRLDPLADRPQLECCSVGRSTYDFEGALRGGSATEGIEPLEAHRSEGTIRITLPATT